MARQRGLVRVEGTIGDIIFYRSIDGYIIREKAPSNAEKILTHPNYKRTRENIAEFGRAAKAAKTLRYAFGPIITKARDSRVTSRLIREMVRVIQTDQLNLRGQRKVANGEAELLQGFNFNAKGVLSTTFKAPFQYMLDRAMGNATITVPPFNPEKMLVAPASGTHFRLFAAAADVDFTQGKDSTDIKESNYFLLDTQQPTTTIHFQMALPTASTHVLFLALGIEFVQELNGNKYPLSSGAFNACALIKVDRVV